jgi:hypothetical protein
LLFGHDQLRRQMGAGRVGLLEGADQRAATDRTHQERHRRGHNQPRPAVAADGTNRCGRRLYLGRTAHWHRGKRQRLAQVVCQTCQLDDRTGRAGGAKAGRGVVDHLVEGVGQCPLVRPRKFLCHSLT